MVKPPKAFAPGNCNAWPDSRCSSKQYFSTFLPKIFVQYSTIFLNWPASRCLFLQTIFLKTFCRVAMQQQCFGEVVHDEAPPESYKSASSPANRPNPWPFDICHHHSTNTTISPRLTFPLRVKLRLTWIFIQVQAEDFSVLPFCLVTLSNKHQDMQGLYQPIN